MIRAAAVATLAGACALLAAAPARAAGDAAIEYLAIEANEGGSSGGHAALRIGEHVYHFQNRDGLLLLARDTPERFLRSYALLGNRSIRASRIRVSRETRALLDDTFRARLGVEQRRADRLAILREDRELLALLARVESGRTGEREAAEALPLRAAGSFRASAEGEPAPALAALRREAQALLGDDFPARRIAALRSELASLAPDPAREAAAAARADAAEAPLVDSFARSVRDRLLALTALEVLREARPLRADGRFSLPDDAFRLAPGEADRVRRSRDALRGDLLRLLASPRTDAGLALLVGMARLCALDHTLREGRWVWLDTFDAGDERIDLTRVPERWSVLEALRLETAHALRGKRERFGSDAAWSEAAYAELEAAANRHREVRRGIAGTASLRVQRPGHIPTRSAPREDWLLPRLPADRLARALEDARAREAAWADRMRELHGYHLIRRNCVSEIFATIDRAFGDSPAESTRRLGGWIGARGHFVPFVSAGAVEANYRVTRTARIPSWRHLQLARMAERELAWWVRLRESNTLTARAYSRGSRDSLFVFFTDGAWPLRPAAGAVNLLAATGESALGLAAAPVTGWRTLRSGLRGALASLAELAFANVRKGSYDYVPSGAPSPAGAAPEPPP